MPPPIPLLMSGDAYSSGSQPSAARSFAKAGFRASTRAALSGIAAVRRAVSAIKARISGTSTRKPNGRGVRPSAPRGVS
jgi:hypothetical protein